MHLGGASTRAVERAAAAGTMMVPRVPLHRSPRRGGASESLCISLFVLFCFYQGVHMTA